MKTSTKNALITGLFSVISAIVGLGAGMNIQNSKIESAIVQSGMITVNQNGTSTEIVLQLLNDYKEANDRIIKLNETIEKLKNGTNTNDISNTDGTLNKDSGAITQALFDLDTFTSSQDSNYQTFVHDWDTNIEMDNLGETGKYKKAKEISCWYTHGEQTDVYLLKRNYSKISGVVLVPYQSKDNTNEKNYGYVEFYNKDILIGTTPLVRGGVKPQNFEISINGVEELTVKYCINSKYLGYSGSNSFSFVVADFTLIE